MLLYTPKVDLFILMYSSLLIFLNTSYILRDPITLAIQYNYCLHDDPPRVFSFHPAGW